MKIRKAMIIQSQRVILSTAICLSLFSCGKQQQSGFNMVKEYPVTTLQPESVELNTSYPTTIKGRQDIEIRPNVSGFITQLCVDEGATVHKGQLLFVIDPVQYEEAVKVAEAAVKVAEANVATAQLTADNKAELAKKNIISDYDKQMAFNTLATQKAALAQAKAQLINAKQNLSYTKVISPSNGVVGTIPLRVGSLVSPSSVTPLTTVSDNSEMFAYFSLNEKQILELAREHGANNLVQNLPEVQLKLSDGTLYNKKGKIATISGIIDQSTGTSNLRAAFPNPDQLLRSGNTGDILVPIKLDSAILVPQTATYEMQDKRFVYIVQDDSTVKNTEIKILNVNDGKNFVVTSGLKAGDRIVLEGAGTLKDGAQIKPISPEEAAAKLKAMTQTQAAGKNK